MKELECDVIQDLLPSYVDKISSNATNKVVEEHIEKCIKCKNDLNNMTKEMNAKLTKNKEERINYLKGYKKRRQLLIIVSILVTIAILAITFVINVKNKNILLDKYSYIDVNKMNVEYMYIKENEYKNDSTGEIVIQKNLVILLNSEEYKGMYLTGSCEYYESDKEIYYKIAAKKLPKDVFFEEDGLEISLLINDNVEKIYLTYIDDTDMDNVKEIWNSDMKIPSEEEWKKLYN